MAYLHPDKLISARRILMGAKAAGKGKKAKAAPKQPDGPEPSLIEAMAHTIYEKPVGRRY